MNVCIYIYTWRDVDVDRYMGPYARAIYKDCEGVCTCMYISSIYI